MAWVKIERSEGNWLSLDTDQICCVHHSMTEEEDWEISGALVDMSNGNSFYLSRDEWAEVRKAMYEEDVRKGKYNG